MKKSYEIVRYGRSGLIFMKIHEKTYEIVRYGRSGLIFMKTHEKTYDFVRYGRSDLIFMKIHEKIVRNRTKWPYGLIFMNIHEKTYEIVRNGRSGLTFMKIHERFVPFDWIISSKNFVTVFHLTLLQCVIGYHKFHGIFSRNFLYVVHHKIHEITI